MGEKKTALDLACEWRELWKQRPWKDGTHDRISDIDAIFLAIPADAAEQLKAKDKGLTLLQRSLSDSLLNAQELERGLAARDEEIALLRGKVHRWCERHEKAEADRDEALKRTVAGLSHDVLTTYGAPNGHGLTLLGRIEALADKCDRIIEHRKKAEARVKELEALADV